MTGSLCPECGGKAIACLPCLLVPDDSSDYRAGKPRGANTNRSPAVPTTMPVVHRSTGDSWLIYSRFEGLNGGVLKIGILKTG